MLDHRSQPMGQPALGLGQDEATGYQGRNHGPVAGYQMGQPALEQNMLTLTLKVHNQNCL
jgi:hypothetical protein